MPSFKIGIIGRTGQLARALIERCEADGTDYIALGREALDLSGKDDAINSALDSFASTHIIINAAAYTAVDAAENDAEMALRVNGTAPGLIAQYCKTHDKGLIHISTDYVFNGQAQTPYPVDHSTDPLGVYGESKLAGETAIKEVGGRFSILRTSWVYDGTGKNFLTTMLRLAETRDTLGVVNDQKGRPTYAPDLAQACLAVAQGLYEKTPGSQGLFHISNSGDIISWADFARAIFATANPHLPHRVTVNNIPTSDYPTPAQRPAFSALEVQAYETVFKRELPNWSSGLERAISVWAQSKGFGNSET